MISLKSILALFAAVALIGCSDNKPVTTTTVRGKVTLDGKPLAAGKITFDATDGTAPTIVDVKEGAYEGKTPAGRMTVRIAAFKLVDMPKTGMTGPEYEKQIEQNYLPAKYHIASKEVRDVVIGGANEFDFAVTSK